MSRAAGEFQSPRLHLELHDECFSIHWFGVLVLVQDAEHEIRIILIDEGVIS